jgi:hypothetical protein
MALQGVQEAILPAETVPWLTTASAGFECCHFVN